MKVGDSDISVTISRRVIEDTT